MSKAAARKLRNNPTDAERFLWYHLRLRQLDGHKFRRQQSLGPYIVDFVCLEKRVVVEVDGEQHSEQVAYDKNRDAWLLAQGFTVLRFWDHDVLTQVADVKQAIWRTLNDSPSNSPPQGGRESEGDSKKCGEGENPRNAIGL